MNYVKFLKEFQNPLWKSKKKKKKIEDKIFLGTSKIYFVHMNKYKCILIRPYER